MSASWGGHGTPPASTVPAERTGRHQAIHSVTQTPTVHISRIEILAVFRCAASLADKEGMRGTAERLRHDADFLDRLTDENARVEIVIHS